MIIKIHFHKKAFATGLVLKQRLAASRKWPISMRSLSLHARRTLIEKTDYYYSRISVDTGHKGKHHSISYISSYNKMSTHDEVKLATTDLPREFPSLNNWPPAKEA